MTNGGQPEPDHGQREREHDANQAPAPSDRAEIFAPGVWVEPADLRFTFTRSSGPGGQAVNKLSTRAQLRVSIMAIVGLNDAARTRLRRMAGQRLVAEENELLFHADTHRSQVQNRRACVQRLRELVQRAHHRPAPRRKSKPSRAMIERRLRGKRERSEKKQRRRRVDPD